VREIHLHHPARDYLKKPSTTCVQIAALRSYSSLRRGEIDFVLIALELLFLFH
jgi:hypothetical protein